MALGIVLLLMGMILLTKPGSGRELIMQNARGTNFYKVALFLILFLCFFSLAIWFLGRAMFPVTQTIIGTLKINDTALLYIVEADVNATTSPSYRYYLTDKNISQADFLESIQESDDYFLLTSEKAKAEVKQGVLFLFTTGTVYKFTNTGSYRVGSSYYHVKVALSSEPE